MIIYRFQNNIILRTQLQLKKIMVQM